MQYKADINVDFNRNLVMEFIPLTFIILFSAEQFSFIVIKKQLSKAQER